MFLCYHCNNRKLMLLAKITYRLLILFFLLKTNLPVFAQNNPLPLEMGKKFRC
jgi:hypothetical protein